MGNLFERCASKQRHKASESEYKFSRIPDKYQSIEQVQEALREAGLEHSNLIVGVDFTRSNTWAGKATFNGRCLHDTSGAPNPYQQVISIVGRTLEAFDDDRSIPAFGFGDSLTTDKSCFPFYPDRPCQDLQDVLDRYMEIAPGIELSGPTNYAPILEKAVSIVKDTNSYHILVLIADGQVTNEEETADALVKASSYPLSVIMVGVGDGPWELMKRFDDDLPQRRFDNFQFVCFSELQQQIVEHQRAAPESRMSAATADAYFAIAMLMEVPEQYGLIRRLGLLKNSRIR
jgi:E3 ubiquitin-protein ligase RGLG